MIKKYTCNSIFVRFPVCFIILACLCAIDNKKQSCIDVPPFQVLDDTVSLASACEAISLSVLSRWGDRDTSRLKHFYRIVDKTADSLTKVLGKDACVNAILDVVYRNWKMTFDSRDDAIETLLPHLAYQNKKGNCTGVSLIILILAEKLKCPIFGVVLPGHFICRYDNGTTRLNIEPNRAGWNHPDEYYRSKYLSRNDSWYTLGNLTKKQTVGVFYYAIGTLSLKRNDNGFAVACLKESVRGLPSFAEAKGNYACALALCGSSDDAMTIFEELFETYPSFINLAANYAAVAMAAGRCQRALQIYKKGLVYFPSDPKLLIGLAQAYAKCGMKDSSHSESSR